MAYITLYKRHTETCCEKHKWFHTRLENHGAPPPDPTFKRCDCPIWFQSNENGKQTRWSSKETVWADAEKKKLLIENGKELAHQTKADAMTVEQAVDAFMDAKRNAGLEEPTLQKLQKTTDRIKDFCAKDGLTNLSDVDMTHVARWDWRQYFNTLHSLITNQERVKSFFRFFHNAGTITKNPTASWQRIKGKTKQVSGFSPAEYQKVLASIPKAGFSPALQARMHALIQLMRHGGLAIIDAATLERTNIRQVGPDYRIALVSRQKTSKKAKPQAIDNAIPPSVGMALVAVLNGNPRFVFWDGGKTGEGSDAEKREAVKYWQKQIRTLLDTAGFPKATSHKFRHTLAIDMIRHGAKFEDVAAALGNTVGVVEKFYSHEWEKQRTGKTDEAIKATWADASVAS